MSIRSDGVMACTNRKAVVTQGQMGYMEAPNTAATVSIHEVEIHPFLMYSSVI
jgi:hypothetical protein